MRTTDQEDFSVLTDQEIITVRVHLGDMGKEILHLEDDAERSDWLLGFHSGALGRASRESWSAAKLSGFNFGLMALAEADAFRRGRSRGGIASAEKRREKSGSAQPNKRRTSAEQDLELSSNSARAPELSSTAVRGFLEQDLEQGSNQPTTYRQQPAASSQNSQQQQPAASESQAFTETPRARPANAPAAPAWNSEQAKQVREAKASDRRQKWIADQAGQVDFTKRPSILQFLSYCRAVHPSWHARAAQEAYETWAAYNWTHGGKKISSWWQLTDAFAFAADCTEHNERVPMGAVAAGLGISESLSAKAAGLTAGERI